MAANGTVLVSDTFVGTNGVTLNGASPDTVDIPGLTWSVAGGAGVNNVVYNGAGGVHLVDPAVETVIAISTKTKNANVRVEATYAGPSTPAATQPLYLYKQISANNYYRVEIWPSSTGLTTVDVSVREIINGVVNAAVSIGTKTVADTSTPHVYASEQIGSTINIYVDGVLLGSTVLKNTLIVYGQGTLQSFHMLGSGVVSSFKAQDMATLSSTTTILTWIRDLLSSLVTTVMSFSFRRSILAGTTSVFKFLRSILASINGTFFDAGLFDAGSSAVQYKVIDGTGAIITDWTNVGISEYQVDIGVSQSAYGVSLNLAADFQGMILWRGPRNGITTYAKESINTYKSALAQVVANTSFPQSGVFVAGSTAGTLKTGLTMNLDQYQNRFIEVTSGGATSQVGEIQTNTITGDIVLKAAKQLINAPAAGDSWRIF